MLRIVLLHCLAHCAWAESQRENNCESLPSLLERIADKDDVSLAAQCRRQFGLKDCEQMILSVGKGPWTQQVRDKACNKIANLLASRDLMDTPLDKVAEHKMTPGEETDEATPSDRHSAPTLPSAPPLATVAPVVLATAPPVVLATAPPVVLATVAPVVDAAAAESAATAAAVVEKAGEEALKSAGHEVSNEVKAATPGLLNALGDTFVGASAQLTPDERKGQENEDRPSWLAASATHPPLDVAKAAENAASAVASTATADALRGAAKALKSAGADLKERMQSAEEQPSWKKEESFHERMESNEKKGPFGIDLGNFVSSHANQDPNEAKDRGSSNGESEELMEDKFDLRPKVADRINTHKMLSWAFIFVALVSLFSSLLIRWRPSAGPTAYSRLEAQVPFSSSRQVRVSSTSRCPEPL